MALAPETDEFTSAFDQMAKAFEPPEPVNTAPKPVESAPAAAEEPAPAAATEEPAPAAATEEPAPAAATEEPAPPAATEEPAPAAVEEPKKEEEDALLARLAKAVREQDTASKPVKAEEPPVAEPEPAPAPIYSEEEQAVLTQYEKDYPDIARAETLRRRSEYQQIVRYVFSELAKELLPLREVVQTVGTRLHLQDLTAAVGDDYDLIREKVIDWANNQPAYLQAAYRQVIEHGTAEEVADLVSRYRQATGAAKPTASSTPPATELPPATKQAAASLAPVSTKRTTPAATAEPAGFDDASERFAASV